MEDGIYIDERLATLCDLEAESRQLSKSAETCELLTSFQERTARSSCFVASLRTARDLLVTLPLPESKEAAIVWSSIPMSLKASAMWQ